MCRKIRIVSRRYYEFRIEFDNLDTLRWYKTTILDEKTQNPKTTNIALPQSHWMSFTAKSVLTKSP